MKTITTLKRTLMMAAFALSSGCMYGQVGVNTTTPKATLDVVAKTTDGSRPEGFIAPRLSGDQVKAGDASYSTAQDGTLMYITSAVTTASAKTIHITTPGYYYYDAANAVWQKVGSGSGSTNLYNADGALTGNRTVDMNAKYLALTNGNMAIGTSSPNSSAVLDVASTTQGFLPPRMTSVQRDAIASPASGLIVYCTNCNDGGTGCLSQNIGTPTVPKWECIGASAAPTVVANCNLNGFAGDYVSGVPLSGATFTTTVTNNSFSTASIGFNAADLVLGNISGLTVGTPTPATATLIAGQSQQVSYPITGTPAGTGTLTGTWNKLTLNCLKTQNVILGKATFSLPQNRYVISMTGLQGVIDNTANAITVSVPYTSGAGAYTAYSGTPVLGATGQGGDTNSFSASYNAGTFGTSGSINVTITVNGDGSYQVKQLTPGSTETIATIPLYVNGENKGNIVLVAMGGKDGSSSALAAESCKYIKNLFPAKPDGVYWLDPDGDTGNAPFQCTCDMTTDGGGWTLVNVRDNTAVAMFSETNTNPIISTTTSARAADIWNLSNTSFPFTSIRFTNAFTGATSSAIATFAASQTLNSLNTTYPSYTATPTNATVTTQGVSTGTLDVINAFYVRAQSGSNAPFSDSSDWMVFGFANNSISAYADQWDTGKNYWILNGTDSNNDPMTVASGMSCSVFTNGVANGSHWSTIKGYRTWVWLK